MYRNRLMEIVEVPLPKRVAELLGGLAKSTGCSVGAAAAAVLTEWARMADVMGADAMWRAVPIDDETAAILLDYTDELGDADVLHLATALSVFFLNAAESKESNGEY